MDGHKISWTQFKWNTENLIILTKYFCRADQKGVLWRNSHHTNFWGEHTFTESWIIYGNHIFSVEFQFEKMEQITTRIYRLFNDTFTSTLFRKKGVIKFLGGWEEGLASSTLGLVSTSYDILLFRSLFLLTKRHWGWLLSPVSYTELGSLSYSSYNISGETRASSFFL